MDGDMTDTRSAGRTPAGRAELAAGTRLGRYRVVRLLGRGGMGQVYLARHELQKSEYALKILPAEFAARPGFVDRFRTELQTMARLHHPRLVQIHYSDVEDGRYYLAMDYVSADSTGEPYDLDEALAVEGRLAPETARRLALELCEGLAYAHGQGVVHRDLKPANVLLTSRELDSAHVKICDFGLAHVAGEEALRTLVARSVERSLSLGDQDTYVEKRRSERSSTGALLGTYGYMSPEQEEGRPVDARSDLYSLGVMLYRMLTGTRLRGRAKAASQVVPGLDPAWDAIIDRCLEAEPAARFASAAELAAALTALGARPFPRLRTTGYVAALAAALAVLAAVGVWFAARGGRVETPQAALSAAARRAADERAAQEVEARRVATERAAAEEARRAADKRAAQEAEARRIATERAAAEEARRVADERAAQEAEARRIATERAAAEEARRVADERAAQEAEARRVATERAAAEEAQRAAAEQEAREALRLARASFGEILASMDAELLALHGGATWQEVVRLRAVGDAGGTPPEEACRAYQQAKAGLYEAQRVARQAQAKETARLASERYAAEEQVRDRAARAAFEAWRLRAQAQLAVLEREGQKARGDAARGLLADSAALAAGAEGLEVARLGGGEAEEFRALLRAVRERTSQIHVEPVAGDTATVTLDNGVAFELVWCPSGCYNRGSPSGERGRIKNEQQHRVTLTHGFWLGKTEVTQRQWEAVMGSNPSHFPGAELPVDTVSWKDCEAFIARLNVRMADGVSAAGPFRLPTEAEWEYACRAGTSAAFAGELERAGWYQGNSGRMTHPVAQKQANAWGLFDLHGNVWEWCQDRYGDYQPNSVTDPQGPVSGAYRVLRGGSWNADADVCRAAYRNWYAPGNRNNCLGLRLARGTR